MKAKKAIFVLEFGFLSSVQFYKLLAPVPFSNLLWKKLVCMSDKQKLNLNEVISQLVYCASFVY
jgi:hypothetical protein